MWFAPNRRRRVAEADLLSWQASQPPMEPPENAGKHQRHDQNTRPEDEHVPGIAQIEVADTTNEQVADGKVEEAPKHIDCRGG